MSTGNEYSDRMVALERAVLASDQAAYAEAVATLRETESDVYLAGAELYTVAEDDVLDAELRLENAFYHGDVPASVEDYAVKPLQAAEEKWNDLYVDFLDVAREDLKGE